VSVNVTGLCDPAKPSIKPPALPHYCYEVAQQLRGLTAACDVFTQFTQTGPTNFVPTEPHHRGADGRQGYNQEPSGPTAASRPTRIETL